MLIQRGALFRSSEITPKSVYLSRRKFLAGTTVAGAMLLAGRPPWETALASPQAGNGRKLSGLVKSPFSTDEKINSFNDVTHYNNFYEFGTDKEQPATLAKNFKTYPWTVAVEGDVGKPGVYDIDKILKLAPLEERIYRHRCVEAWSIVVPWIGFPLNVLIQLVEPAAKAK